RRITQDAGFMRIRAQRIETCFACSAAYGDDGDLATEVDESFVDERRRAELLPGGRHVLRAAQETLSAPVISHAARLEYARQSDAAHRGLQIVQRVDRLERRRRDAELAEQRLLVQTILG